MPQGQSQNASLVGSQIRERRQSLGLRQAEVAVAAGISASYLNLIEHNRRNIRGDVLAKLADCLGVDVSHLAEGAGSAVIDDLRAAAAAAPSVPAELERVEDFAGRFPGWAALVSATHARAEQLERMVEILNDRITHDPHLSAALHELLSALSAVRSTAAILAETEDIDPDWRARFHTNIHEDSERLATGAEALVAYLDRTDLDVDQSVSSPQEEIEGWIAARGWQLPELETPDGRAALLNEVSDFASLASRKLAAAFISQAASEAHRLPLAELNRLIHDHGEDPAMIAGQAGVPVLVAMRRMALRPGTKIGLVTCDGSGTLIFRKPIEGFALPRFGSACPLWPLFTALARPASPIQATLFVAGRSSTMFQALALCEVRLPIGFGGPELREAGMLIRPLDTIEPGRGAEQVGSSCRICPRRQCPARREPSIVSELP